MSNKLAVAIFAIALATVCGIASAQPKSQEVVKDAEVAPDEDALDLPANLNLTNAGGKSKTPRPPAPAVNRQVDAKLLPKVADDHLQKLVAEQEGAENQPEAARTMLAGVSQHMNLRNADAPTASSIPDGMVVETVGGVWLADGGYLPPGASVAYDAGFQIFTNMTPGGGNPYSSATTYTVQGDMISINKGIQIGNQPMVISNLTVRSGETATVRLPDGSIFTATPTLRPMTPQEAAMRAQMNASRP